MNGRPYVDIAILDRKGDWFALELRVDGRPAVRDFGDLFHAHVRREIAGRFRARYPDLYDCDQIAKGLLEVATKHGAESIAPLFRFTDASEFLDHRFTVRWWIDGVFKRDVPTTIFGPSKSLKTSLAVDLATSIAVGGRFLGRFPIIDAGKVGYVSGEIVGADLQSLVQVVTTAKGILPSDLRGRMFIETTVPQFGKDRWQQVLVSAIKEDGLDILFIDPTYFAMADADPSKLSDVGARLQAIREAVDPTGCQLVLIHHSTKGQARPTKEYPDINDMSGAGYAEWTRQWIGVNRQVAYDHSTRPGWHRLNCQIGSFRAGWAGVLEIEEGNSQDSIWRVETLSREEVLEQKAKNDAEKDAALETEIRTLLRDERRGEWVTLSAIISRVSGGRDRVKRALHSLQSKRLVEQSEAERTFRGGKSMPWRSLERACDEPAST